jgi:hypothetical protein
MRSALRCIVAVLRPIFFNPALSGCQTYQEIANKKLALMLLREETVPCGVG